MATNVAIIGSAGRRDDGPRLNKAMWDAMLSDARQRISTMERPITAVSGGAAWSDHLAVALYLEGAVDGLRLHLPAEMRNGRFVEDPSRGNMDPGRTANYYHGQFLRRAGIDGLAQLNEAVGRGAAVDVGVGFKERNLVVAREADVVIAYTFGGGREATVSGPGADGYANSEAAGLRDGGTSHTWSHARNAQLKIHVPLDMIETALGQGRPVTQPQAGGERMFTGEVRQAYSEPMADGRKVFLVHENGRPRPVRAVLPAGTEFQIGQTVSLGGRWRKVDDGFEFHGRDITQGTTPPTQAAASVRDFVKPAANQNQESVITNRVSLEAVAIHGSRFFEAATRDGLPERINSNPDLAALKSSLSQLGGTLMKWGLVARVDGRFVSVPQAVPKLSDAAARDILSAFAEAARPETVSGIRHLGASTMLDALEKARPFLDESSPPTQQEETGKQAGLFRTEPFITRNMLQANPDTLYVFGDNLARQGLGGQAKEMRGEKNAVGIPTKKAPRRDEAAYFTDADFETAAKSMAPDIARLKSHIAGGGTIVFPSGGIGTGLAELSRRAPKIDAYIKAQIQDIRSLSRDSSPATHKNPGIIPIDVLNKKSLPRGPLPADILDISRYGTLMFGNDTKPTLGNPFVMNEYRGHDGSREDVVRKYASKLAADFDRPGFKDWFRKVTEGKKSVACFCAPELCHGFVTKAAIEAIRAGRDPQEAIRPFQTDPVAARAAQENRDAPVPAVQRTRQSGYSR